MAASDHPVPHPFLTACILNELAARDHSKPTAHGTRLRYSSSGSCTRKLGDEAHGLEPTDPFDAPSLWVTFLGSIIHEHAQAAIANKYGAAATFEVTSMTVECDSSGSADAVVLLQVSTEIGDVVKVLWELKTVNGTAFKMGIGVDAKKYGPSPKGPKGPRWTARLQAAVNALANDCDLVVIGYLAMEGISKGLAERCGLSELDRVVAEWVYEREVWEPWARAEIQRQAEVLDSLDVGNLPERWVINDDGEAIPLAPEASRRPWNCDYCSFLTRCLEDGPGLVPVPVEIGATR
jgi:hypothetical protein